MEANPTPTENETIVQFPGAGGAQAAEAPAPAAPAEPPPWVALAEEWARKLYCAAHGLAELPVEVPADRARIADMARQLEPEFRTSMQAVLSWAGVTLYLHRVQEALRHVVLRAEIHPPSRGRHNERVLVFADRLEALADVMTQQPKGYAEATAFWKAREEQLTQLAELPRIMANVERVMGEPPPAAAGLHPVEKLEAMLTGLVAAVQKQNDIIGKQEQQLKTLLRRK
jgi:hypothetical protein